MYPLNLSKGIIVKKGFKYVDGSNLCSKVIDLDGAIWQESEHIKEGKYLLTQCKCVDIVQAEAFMFSDGYR